MQTTEGQKLTHVSLTLRANCRQTLETVLGVQVKFYSRIEFRKIGGSYYAIVDYFCEESNANKAQANVMDDIDIDSLEAYGVKIENVPHIVG